MIRWNGSAPQLATAHFSRREGISLGDGHQKSKGTVVAERRNPMNHSVKSRIPSCQDYASKKSAQSFASAQPVLQTSLMDSRSEVHVNSSRATLFLTYKVNVLVWTALRSRGLRVRGRVPRTPAYIMGAPGPMTPVILRSRASKFQRRSGGVAPASVRSALKNGNATVSICNRNRKASSYKRIYVCSLPLPNNLRYAQTPRECSLSAPISHNHRPRSAPPARPQPLTRANGPPPPPAPPGKCPSRQSPFARPDRGCWPSGCRAVRRGSCPRHRGR